MSKEPKLPKQLTLYSLPNAKDKTIQIHASINAKRIVITEIKTLTKEDELELRVGFALYPSERLVFKVEIGFMF